MKPNQPLTGTARAQVPARLLDLSVGGALLQLATALEVGTIHDFSLLLDDETVWVQGEVKRCRPSDSGFQAGIAFVGIAPRDERRLHDYVERRR